MPSASRVAWARFRVTVVSGVALAILATLAFLLTGGTLLQAKTTLYLYVPDATGLIQDAPVRVDGIDVGKVAKVELSGQGDPNRVVRVVMRVERDRLDSITADSVAEIGSDSLIGDKFVDVTSGKSPGHVPANGEIRMKPASVILKTVDLTQFEAQLRNVDALLADIEAGKNQIGQFVQGTDVYTELRDSVGKIQSAFHAAVSTTSSIGDALYTERIYRQVLDPMVKLDQALATLQSGQGRGGALLRDPAQYESMRKQVQDLRASVGSFRNSVWLQSDQMYRDWDGMVGSVIQKVDTLNRDPLLNSTATYESLEGMVRETRDSLKDFRENPRKYLRLKVF